MAKSRKIRRGGKTRKHKAGYKSRSKRGGDGSAWQYELNKVGDLNTQVQNALTVQPGQSIATQHSNTIVPVGQPNASQSSYVVNMKGGKRRQKKGGYWSQVLSRAIVPFTLLGLQQKFGKKTRKH